METDLTKTGDGLSKGLTVDKMRSLNGYVGCEFIINGNYKKNYSFMPCVIDKSMILFIGGRVALRGVPQRDNGLHKRYIKYFMLPFWLYVLVCCLHSQFHPCVYCRMKYYVKLFNNSMARTGRK